MIKFSEKHYSEDVVYENGYNHHPYTDFCSPEYMVKVFGWSMCRKFVLENIKKGYSSKMNVCNSKGFQYEFFACDLQHLLSHYYDDIPKYYQ